MKFEIKHRSSGSVLFSIETDSWKLAVEAAVRSGANLSGANLSRANLSGANLSWANLSGADISWAKHLNKFLTTPLYGMLDQHDPLVAYKLVTADGIGPFNGGITYTVGHSYEEPNADTDERESCGAGINLASLDWCLRHYKSGFRILIAEFHKADIAAIPIGSDGKFRVHRCRIVGEKSLADVGVKEEA